MLPATEIYRINRKRRGRSRSLLSSEIRIDSRVASCSIPARLVYLHNRSRHKDYLVLISTDMTISEDDIVRIYGKRCGREVFFKVSKTYLKLTKECHSPSYDAMTAYVVIAFARYMMLAIENRT